MEVINLEKLTEKIDNWFSFQTWQIKKKNKKFQLIIYLLYGWLPSIVELNL